LTEFTAQMDLKLSGLLKVALTMIGSNQPVAQALTAALSH
jgi:hypothetical protein